MRLFKSLLLTLLVVGSLNSCKKDEPTDEVKNLPEVTTKPVSNIGMAKAECGGVIISDGGLDITQRGVCWSTQPNPTIADSFTSDDAGTGEFKSVMTNLDYRTKYYVRAYAKNKDGIAYGLQMEFTTIPPTVGAEYGGGIVAYLFQPNDNRYSFDSINGIIVSLDSIISKCSWGCEELDGTNGNIGLGQYNTKFIVDNCNESMTAATICWNLSIKGFNDWFLPSHLELVEIENALRDELTKISAEIGQEQWWSSSAGGEWVSVHRTGSDRNNWVDMKKFSMNGAIPARYFSVPK